MKWELGALKILARNPTVPSVALLDTINEIEKLQVELNQAVYMQEKVRSERDIAETENTRVRDALRLAVEQRNNLRAALVAANNDALRLANDLMLEQREGVCDSLRMHIERVSGGDKSAGQGV
jgi:uncharacterized protein (DUF3084 family)